MDAVLLVHGPSVAAAAREADALNSAASTGSLTIAKPSVYADAAVAIVNAVWLASHDDDEDNCANADNMWSRGGYELGYEERGFPPLTGCMGLSSMP